MNSKQDTQTARWFIYFVTVTLGLAFSAILFWIAWTNALEKNERDFSLQSISLKETINRNVRTANSTTRSIASFIDENPDLTQHQFEIFINALFNENPFVEAALYIPLNSGYGPDIDPDGTATADALERTAPEREAYQVLGNDIESQLESVEKIIPELTQTLLSSNSMITSRKNNGPGIRTEIKKTEY
jgi:hypothetical protein